MEYNTQHFVRKLEAMGIQEGDTVAVFDFEFEYIP